MTVTGLQGHLARFIGVALVPAKMALADLDFRVSSVLLRWRRRWDLWIWILGFCRYCSGDGDNGNSGFGFLGSSLGVDLVC